MNQGLLFIGLGGSAGARISLKSNWAGAAEICRFIFIGGWGGGGERTLDGGNGTVAGPPGRKDPVTVNRG